MRDAIKKFLNRFTCTVTSINRLGCPDVSALGHYRTISALTLHHFGTDMQLHREMVRMKL